MRRLATTLVMALFLTMALASTALAHPAGPCDDFGGPGHSDYARHHIVNATPGHVPGTHGGYSFCLGTGRSVHKPPHGLGAIPFFP